MPITAEDRRLFPELRFREDAYGYRVNDEGNRLRRHPQCECEVPCQMRYTCEGPHHIGNRSTPWCSGGASGEIRDAWCDVCWNREEERRTAKRRVE
jgi:hypothetical protein